MNYLIAIGVVIGVIAIIIILKHVFKKNNNINQAQGLYGPPSMFEPPEDLYGCPRPEEDPEEDSKEIEDK